MKYISSQSIQPFKTVAEVKAEKQRKDTADSDMEKWDWKNTEIFLWAKRICHEVNNMGFQESPFRKVNVYTEFTGSSCAESAVESVVNNMLGKHKIELRFKSMADIKTTCRTVCMATRRSLRLCILFLLCTHMSILLVPRSSYVLFFWALMVFQGCSIL